MSKWVKCRQRRPASFNNLILLSRAANSTVIKKLDEPECAEAARSDVEFTFLFRTG
jgi:hypothetical protein